MTDGAPIELLGFDLERDVILARREGEPLFLWVQDLGDAYQAAASRGGVAIVVSRRVYDEHVRPGFHRWNCMASAWSDLRHRRTVMAPLYVNPSSREGF